MPCAGLSLLYRRSFPARYLCCVSELGCSDRAGHRSRADVLLAFVNNQRQVFTFRQSFAAVRSHDHLSCRNSSSEHFPLSFQSRISPPGRSTNWQSCTSAQSKNGASCLDGAGIGALLHPHREGPGAARGDLFHFPFLESGALARSGFGRPLWPVQLLPGGCQVRDDADIDAENRRPAARL